MRNGKFTVERMGDIYVISDGGRIARVLGIKDGDEWQLVAPNALLVGDRIDRMEKLFESAKELRAVELIDSTMDAVASRTVAAQPTSIQFHIPTKGSKADIDLNELPHLDGGAHYRLRQAGISTVGQLVGFSRDELLELRGIGETTVLAIEEAIRAPGYRLKQRVC